MAIGWLFGVFWLEPDASFRRNGVVGVIGRRPGHRHDSRVTPVTKGMGCPSRDKIDRARGLWRRFPVGVVENTLAVEDCRHGVTGVEMAGFGSIRYKKVEAGVFSYSECVVGSCDAFIVIEGRNELLGKGSHVDRKSTICLKVP